MSSRYIVKGIEDLRSGLLSLFLLSDERRLKMVEVEIVNRRLLGNQMSWKKDIEIILPRDFRHKCPFYWTSMIANN
jgi:hypothetical protein